MSAKKTVTETVWQPGRNNGKLKVGNPGCKGGTGRPKSEVRDLCQAGFEAALPELRRLATDAEYHSDRLRAMDLLGKYAGLQQIDNTSGDQPLPKAYIVLDPAKDFRPASKPAYNEDGDEADS